MSDIKDTRFQPRWMGYTYVQRIISMYEQQRIPICFLGGAVRDALAKREPRDYDLLIAAPANTTLQLLKQAGLPAYVTNKFLGTARTVINDRMFDFSPLMTSPEFPSPVFTERTREYVRKSDFTMNSLYWLPDGRLFDHYGGVEDLQAGRVRFIQDARQSLEGNFIRVLRFFRFHANYGKGDPDPQGLSFCKEYAQRIPDSHPIRIQQQMFKLLLAPACYPTLEVMRTNGILEPTFGMRILSCQTLAEWEKIEALLKEPARPRLRLLSLLWHADIPPSHALAQVVKKWQLPEELHQHTQAVLDAVEGKTALESLHPERKRQVLMLQWALAGCEAGRAQYEALFAKKK